MPDDNTHDVHLQLLAELLYVLDGHYQRIERAIRESPDPDAFGEFDRGEHLIGLAFVACQTYIAATCGRSKLAKREALDVGAPMAGGLTAARLLNHAANFWKHHREPDDRHSGRGAWPTSNGRSPDPRQGQWLECKSRMRRELHVRFCEGRGG
jgi:hypothetical protein